MISQEAALPTQVLIPSIACRNFWTSIHPPFDVRPTRQGTIRSPPPDGASSIFTPSDRRLRVRPEVVLERHPAAHDGVLLPLGGALGEGDLRLGDLLEQRILRRVLL